MIFKAKRLETLIVFWQALLALIILMLVSFVTCLLDFAVWQIVAITLVVSIFFFFSIIAFRDKIMTSFKRAILHLEAVRQEDYKLYSKTVFQTGLVGDFHQNLKDFSEDLSTKKQRYDQHAFLVYQLIDQLQNPVLIFNQKEQLSYANGAFRHLYGGQAWQRFRNASPKLLGLYKNEKSQQFTLKDKQKSLQWHISQSTFIDAGVAHQLLVFANIESAIRSSQVKAWRQLISVMGHEIRNSLTPVSTIAESLAERSSTGRDKVALALISDRCSHLQDFITRYASLSKSFNLHYSEVNTVKLATRLKGLFEGHKLKVVIRCKHIWADESLLEQVLINLLQNAVEANADTVSLEFVLENNRSIIKVVDNGHGFANRDSAFVPLYSTKEHGQGIGLSFCRNIIEQHNGSINLDNNIDTGVTVTVLLHQRAD